MCNTAKLLNLHSVGKVVKCKDSEQVMDEIHVTKLVSALIFILSTTDAPLKVVYFHCLQRL